MSQNNRKNYYVIVKGVQKGVVDSWAECCSYTNGVPNKFHGFFTWREVQRYIISAMPETGGYLYAVAGDRRCFDEYTEFIVYVMNRHSN